MSAIISALDNFTPSQVGEKGSIEYTWSNSIRESIIQLNFQLTRAKDKKTIYNLSIQTDKILTQLTKSFNNASITREEYIEYMSIMYRMIGHTRDIIDGKGEYTLSYMLLDVWQTHFPKLAYFAFRHFVLPPEGTTDFHPYGSWKDIKYIHKYTQQYSDDYGMRLILEYGIDLMIYQLRADAVSDNPSLAAKWVPREKSKYSELFTRLATIYFYEYMVSGKTIESVKRGEIKAKMDFRKLISSLNKKLDTVQIKQCGQNWAEIKPENQTSITMHKQKKAFLNINKNGEQRSELPDRVACAENFTDFVKKAVNGEVKIKGKRVGLNDFTKDAINLCEKHLKTSDEAAILNAQWIDNSTQTGRLGKMIAMVDVSGSMNGDPMNAAIALGIRVAEQSLIGKRILTFSATPSWVNLSEADNFVEMVDLVRTSDWGMNTNFASALKMILDSIIINKLTSEDVEDMVFAIFSDMQIDEADRSFISLMDLIERQYADAGQRVWGKPFKTPHILFWNLRSTSGFPTLSTNKNCSMMSGFNPSLLNLFCEEGLDALQSCTPWSLFVKGLNNERYSVLDQHIRQNI
jgi:hypothetical protein